MRNLVWKIFKPSPFKAGVAVSIIVTLLYLSSQSGGYLDELNITVNSLDWRASDTMFRIRGERPTTGRVVIVDIDEFSLQERRQDGTGGMGQWPWPRTVMAELLRNISAAQPKIIGLDIVYAEEDRSSPKNYVEKIAPHLPEKLSQEEIDRITSLPEMDNDLALAKTLSDTPVILGYFFKQDDDGLLKETEHFVDFSGGSRKITELDSASHKYLDNIETFNRPVLNINVLTQNSLGAGYFNPSPDIDGLVRRVPMYIRFMPAPLPEDGPDAEINKLINVSNSKGILYPSLALEMLREAEEIDPYDVSLVFGSHGLRSITVGEHIIPTGFDGKVTVNYRGAGGPENKKFKYIHASDIYYGKPESLAALKDKYVLVGTSAAGLLDTRSTPFSQAFPGVEVHATIIDNVLAGDLIKRQAEIELPAVLFASLFLGIALSAALAYGGAVAGGITGAVFIIAVTSGNYYFLFLNNYLVGVICPLFTLIGVLIVVNLANYFTEGKQKSYIREAFGRYVSPEVVQELVRNPEKLSLGGEKRNISIFFSDIRNFTSISEKLDPHEMGQFLNEYLTSMSDIIMQNGGMVDKFIGDAIVAMWGAPLDNPQHPVSACRSALLQMQTLRELRKDWETRGMPFIDIGIGINTGPASVGNMGSRSRFDYTMIGDNVNLAARLEGVNKQYGTNILISDATRLAAGSNFVTRFVDRVRVKGKLEPVAIYELVGEGAIPDDLRNEIAAFEKMTHLYHDRKFEEAREVLVKLSTKDGRKLYDVYLERLELYIKTPPPEDWDGVYTLTSK